MKKQPTVHLVANFGQQPFIFDIDGMVQVRPAASQHCSQPPVLEGKGEKFGVIALILSRKRKRRFIRTLIPPVSPTFIRH